MRITTRIIFGAFAFLYSSNTVIAWDAFVEGPDVFDKTSVVASEIGFSEGIVIQCDSVDQLLIAFVTKKKEFDPVSEAPASLLFKFGDEAPLKLDASLRTWNDNFAGVVASGRTPDIVKVVRSIMTAKGKIKVGADVQGSQESAEISSRGSTKSMETVLSKCKLETLDAKSQ